MECNVGKMLVHICLLHMTSSSVYQHKVDHTEKFDEYCTLRKLLTDFTSQLEKNVWLHRDVQRRVLPLSDTG
ncbi:hypothetical protein RvY_09744-3 [Ramazzottius varieornatus]|uniref:Uncharacterized protein n=1 Tax=Ramazzottius varieornatus TaxID=947166 RepID=A0A1D1VAF3_RAMVA|nr:hypothetical protein RvY_09744-3 [Ramazzottius varieornatus]